MLKILIHRTRLCASFDIDLRKFFFHLNHFSNFAPYIKSKWNFVLYWYTVTKFTTIIIKSSSMNYQFSRITLLNLLPLTWSCSQNGQKPRVKVDKVWSTGNYLVYFLNILKIFSCIVFENLWTNRVKIILLRPCNLYRNIISLFF